MESPKETDKTRMTQALGVRNKCPVAKLCGGCSYAGRSYFEQAQAKEKRVRRNPYSFFIGFKLKSKA